MVQLLVEAGCDINSKCQIGITSEVKFITNLLATAVHYTDNQEMIKYILAKIDSAELNFQCMTEKIQFEIEQEPSEDPTYPLGFTPLMFALWNGNFESIDLLIKHKVDTNIKT